VIPALEAIRKEFPEVALSIDTFHSEVACCAVDAGADMVNDISSGEMDPEMLKTVQRLGVPYIMNHTRGTPQTMLSKANYDEIGGVVNGIVVELGNRIDQLLQAGFPRWLLISDPGLGFAKNYDHNLEVVRDLRGIKVTSP